MEEKGKLLVMDNEAGGVFDLSDVAGDVKLQHVWNDGASTFTFTYPRQGGRRFSNGSTVTFQYDGANMFYGYLQKTGGGRTSFKATCNDQLRYFKPKNTILRKEMPLSDWVNQVAAAVSDNDRIRLGSIDSTAVNLSKKLFDSKSHLDMLYDAIEENLGLNGYWYTLYDDYGALALRDTLDLRLPLVIGDESLCTDFDYEKSIESDDVANYIKLAKDNEDAGVREVYVTQDSANISRWGKIMYFEKVTTNRNEAQMQQLAQMLLVLKNKEAQTLKLDAIGDTRVRAGSGIKVELAAENLNAWMVVDSVTHTFTSSQHTMSMNLRWGEWT